MIRGRVLFLERHGGIQKLREIGYKVGEIARKVSLSSTLRIMYSKYKNRLILVNNSQYYFRNALRVHWQ